MPVADPVISGDQVRYDDSETFHEGGKIRNLRCMITEIKHELSGT